MPSWNEILLDVDSYIKNKFIQTLGEIGKLRDGRNVIFYASAFLQKQYTVPAYTLMLTMEDINGFMSMVHQMDCTKGLTLLLHTPGGEMRAVQPIVEYLHSKFDSMEAIVPTYAMSAGTVISLAADYIIMGKHSQLGPIDPQMFLPNGASVSADSVKNSLKKPLKKSRRKKIEVLC